MYSLRWAFKQIFAVCVGVCLVAAGCQTNSDGRPPGHTVWIDQGDARLIFNVPALAQINKSSRRFTDQSGQFVEEASEWDSNRAESVIAGLLLSEASVGSPLTDPQDPREVVQLWAVFRKQTPTFGTLNQSTNVLGPILWRRTSIGTRACVVFLQRWSVIGSLAPTAPITNLSGYYCRAVGAVFPPEFAENVIKSVGLRQNSPKPFRFPTTPN